ncbi:HTH DNA binding domain protein [anaerobic digester metagenome]
MTIEPIYPVTLFGPHMRSVTLKVRMIDEHICCNCLSGLEELGLSLKVLRCAPMGTDCAHSLMRIDGDPAICERLLSDPPVLQGQGMKMEMARSGNGTISLLVVNERCRLSHLISESGCFLELAIPAGGEGMIFHLLGTDADSINNFVRLAKEEGYAIEVISTYEKTEWGGLTFRHERDLRMAFELGYFDIPSRVTLDELASRIGCSKSTLNVILRRAERKIISDHLSGSK